MEVRFEQSAKNFSSASLGSALAAGGDEATAISIEACGSIRTDGNTASLTSGATRLLLDGTASPPIEAA